MALSSSKPAGRHCCCRSMEQTDGRTDTRPLHSTVRAFSVLFLWRCLTVPRCRNCRLFCIVELRTLGPKLGLVSRRHRMHCIDAAYCYSRRTFRGRCVCLIGQWSRRWTLQNGWTNRDDVLGRLVCAQGTIIRCGAHRRHLANTIEWFVPCCDASYVKHFFDHLFY